MLLAKFQSLDDPTFVLYYEPTKEKYTDLVRVSEYAEVEFTPRPAHEIEAVKMPALEKKRDRLRAQLARLEVVS